MQFDLSKRLDEHSTFIFASPNQIGTEEYFTEHILPTKRSVDDPKTSIEKHFDRTRKIEGSTIYQTEVIRSAWHWNHFVDISDFVKNQLLEITDLFPEEANQYTIDTKDGSIREILFLHGKNESLRLEFGKYIH